MPGALILAFVIVVVLPVTILMSGAVVAALLGWTATEDAEGPPRGQRARRPLVAG